MAETNVKLHPDMEPFESTAANAFDATKAAHLLNRAGFGGTPAEIERYQKMGLAGAVDALLDFQHQSAEEQDPKNLPDLTALNDYPDSFQMMGMKAAGKTPEERQALLMKAQNANRQTLMRVGDWWLNRMSKAAYPLQEKLTLFWHGHFTTSARDERLSRMMWIQNETLRKHAAGNFGKFVKAISRDPAMLDYLNNQQNRKGRPNENYARELMELFTLGIGNYTEADIKDAARAFTGWGHSGAEFIFRKFDHDYNGKTFMGKTGNFNGDDIIDIILQQPICPKYIASRIWNFFVSETENPAAIASMAEVLKANNYELKPVLKLMFSSKAFYSNDVIGSQIKSPIQLMVGTVRLLNVDMPPSRILLQPGGPMMQMGQAPFLPPNVKGWPGGRAWINTSTLFMRYNAMIRLAGEMKNSAITSSDPADKIVDSWISKLIQRPISAEQRTTLIDAIGGKPDAESIRKMVQLIVSMPEYQVC